MALSELYGFSNNESAYNVTALTYVNIRQANRRHKKLLTKRRNEQGFYDRLVNISDTPNKSIWLPLVELK